MAVQAQHPSNAFSPDFRSRIQSSNVMMDELCMIQGKDNLQVHGESPFVFNNNNNNETAFSNPQSELTCNASGSRKRMREESGAMAHHQQFLQTPIRFGYPNIVVDPSVSLDQSRLIESAGTSTSGRFACSSSPAIGQDLVAQLFHQSLEIDALVRLQNERLRLGLEERRKRHCRALISVLEQRLMNKLKEKDGELESASRRNAELEERVRQMSAENQIWFNVAKNNEAIVSTLRTSLEQVLLQSTVNAAPVQMKEGYGDSDGTQFPADDAQSCCFVGEEERTDGAAKRAVRDSGSGGVGERYRRSCKVCGEKDVSVLLLPCRHLCLCRDCESKVDACPICHVAKNACLQIFMA